MRSVIITGANGFVGSMLVKRLLREGIKVVAVDKSFEINHLPENENLVTVVADLGSGKELHSLLKDEYCDVFYHLAWQGVNGQDKASPDVQLQNIHMMLNCVKVAKSIGCKRFLMAGTVAERAVESLSHLQNVNGGMMYGTAKHCAHMLLETYCKNIGLNFVWMQFSNIYGPANKTGNLVSYTIGELKNSREATFGPAIQPYDFIYVDDLLEAIYRLGRCEIHRDSYFIGSGTPRLLKEYLLVIGRACGKESLLKIGARQDDGIVYKVEMFDTTDLVQDIGEYVTHTFEDGIKSTLEDY